MRVRKKETASTKSVPTVQLKRKSPHSTFTLTMKLDATDLRYVTSDEFRVLTAVRFSFVVQVMFVDEPLEQVEMGSKNHEIVPLQLIVQISGLRNGGVNKLVGSLAKRNLISKVQNAKCEMVFCLFVCDSIRVFFWDR